MLWEERCTQCTVHTSALDLLVHSVLSALGSADHKCSVQALGSAGKQNRWENMGTWQPKSGFLLTWICQSIIPGPFLARTFGSSSPQVW